MVRKNGPRSEGDQRSALIGARHVSNADEYVANGITYLIVGRLVPARGSMHSGHWSNGEMGAIRGTFALYGTGRPRPACGRGVRLRRYPSIITGSVAFNDRLISLGYNSFVCGRSLIVGHCYASLVSGDRVFGRRVCGWSGLEGDFADGDRVSEYISGITLLMVMVS